MEEFVDLFTHGDEFYWQDYIPPFVVFAILTLFGFVINQLFDSNLNERLAWFFTRFDQVRINKKASETLELYFPYYQNLNKSAKKKFLRRLAIFMEMKTFIPRSMEMNEKVNFLIGATAVQLTFGWNTFAFLSFERILIYPTSYYSQIREVYHKGEINVRLRLIVLSAMHFVEGLKNTKDGINLGLHEMSHAMQVHAIISFDKRFIKLFNKWKPIAQEEIERIKTNKNHFLRTYAATNAEEMFAVCVENFFERPEGFKKELPELYAQLRIILNQDPLRSQSPVGA